jgi:glycosyltransferase involved in cell wall biosynthesis
MQQPYVSISCLTYNHKEYITACLEGILMQQTNFEIEVLVYDDASTDTTPSIIKDFQARYPEIIKPIFQSENQLSKGNRLLNPTYNYPRAKGKYIALCDGDDYWTDPLKLQKQVDYLEANPNCAMCFHKVEEKFEDYVRFKTFSHLEDKFYTGYEILKRWTIPTSSVVLRNYGKRLVPNDNRILFGDIVLYLKLAHMGTLRCLAAEGEMAVYRRHLEGVTKVKRSADFLNGLLKHFEYLEETFDQEISITVKRKSTNVLFSLFIRTFPKKDSFSYLKKAFYQSEYSIYDLFSAILKKSYLFIKKVLDSK